ncbi:acetylglutamate kinase [Cryobacterium sp. BB736]|uniref:acetylglutamate kinase n=1 Tax=Cryobacterium sp. BB736 TaxID=2746963 RepID=UPI00187360CF|nr:acetylglutamate kinase [Cryobacterium sp. BB736]
MTDWLSDHHGETVVVKFGGNAMVDAELGRAFAEDIVALKRAGLTPVVTHGGGPQISAALEARGIQSEFRGGLRYTTPDAVLVVRDVLASIGRELADRIAEAGEQAEAIVGDERSLFLGAKRNTMVDGEPVDLGQVGDVVEVDPVTIAETIGAGRIPVISAIALDRDARGSLLNVNADSAAASVAIALGADRLIILTDVPGLYGDWPNRDSLIRELDAAALERLLPSLESGMIPKMTACLHAVRGGVARAAIIDGTTSHPLTREPFGVSGTTIVEGSGQAT